MLMPTTTPRTSIVYPESDGEPMSDNTRQFRWIIVLACNLAALFRDRADVFVSGNQFWYPIEGEPDVRASPDVYVVFGRPRGDRSSWKQWEEDNVPMTVVFEILSPGNTHLEMVEKFTFYEDHGVEEYYLYDPETNQLVGYVRRGAVLRRVRPIHDFVSPRLGIRFDLSGPELVVRYPDGRPFLTFEELETERVAVQQQADNERRRAEQAEQRAEKAEDRAEKAEQRAARLAELTRKVLEQRATPEELRELESLLQQPS